MGRSRRRNASTSWSKWSLESCWHEKKAERHGQGMVVMKNLAGNLADVRKSLRMVVRKKNQMYVRQVVEINSRIGALSPSDARSKVYMTTSVQEVGLSAFSSCRCYFADLQGRYICHQPESFPLPAACQCLTSLSEAFGEKCITSFTSTVTPTPSLEWEFCIDVISIIFTVWRRLGQTEWLVVSGPGPSVIYKRE